MKVLLDEQIDVRMKSQLSDFEVYTLHDFGWLGLKNGALALQLQANVFQFLVTADKNIPFQQKLDKIDFTLILLDTPSLLWENQILFSTKLLTLLQNLPEILPKVIHLSVEGLSIEAKKAALIKLVGEERILFL